MANIALITASRVEVVESIVQMTLPAAEAITAGAPVRIDTTAGTFTNANASSAAEARIYGIATRTVAAGEALTAIRLGVMDGFDVSASNFDAPLYLSDTDGRVADGAGTVDVVIGRVIPASGTTLGTAYDKIVAVDCISANAALDQGVAGADVPVSRIVITSELLAASVDKWIFIADRAYQVTQVEEIHSVVGGSGAVVRPRKVTAAGTDAPGAAAGATVKELTAADIDLVATINVTQTPALTATAADLLLADGDKIGLNFGGTQTGLVGSIAITLRPV